MKKEDQKLVDEGIFTTSEIRNMRKRNPKGCIYHGLEDFGDCYHCGLYNK